MGGLSSLFGSKSSTTTLEPMLTNEQKQALAQLMGYGTTGVTPTGYQAGQNYDLSKFSFNAGDVENSALANLLRYVQGGEDAGLTRARDTFSTLADTTFNPEDQSTGLGAFRKALARETRGASDVLNREAAMTGSRFGTGIQRQKTDLAARQSEQMGMKLAELFNNQQNRALQASQGLTGLAGLVDEINRGKIQTGFNYGGFERDLANQKANLEYSDWQRKRDEQLSAFGTLGDIYNRNVDFGIKSYTTKTPSMFSQLASAVLPAVGTALGGQIGGMISGGVSSLFGNLFKPTQSQILGFNTANYR